MNHQIRRIALITVIAMLALLANLARTQVLQAEDLRNNSGNTRLLLEEYGRQRGAIVVDGIQIARSNKSGGTLAFERSYPFGELYAPATGFYSLIYGATGIERIYNSILSGRDDRLVVDRIQQLLAGQSPRGGIVTLTLNREMQQAAFEALAGRRGAVVAIDAESGAILTLVSSPSFDPTSLSINKPDQVRTAYDALLANEDQPLINRPLTQSLPPGSTFKLVVAAAALESGKFTPDSVLPGPATIKLPQSDKLLGNWQEGPCSASGKVTLRRALEVSCNTAFAWLGMQLGQEAIDAQARAFGFNESIAIPLVAATSVFPQRIDDAQLAMSSIGQFDVRATALQMAMVTAAIAHEGNLMNPFLVKNVMTTEFDMIEQYSPSSRRAAMSSTNAQLLLDMMRTTVTKGTASSGIIEGLTVGAKTGTAESGTDAPAHAWFVATGESGGRAIVVSVVVENGGGEIEVSGNRIAGPIAQKVLKAGFRLP
jgi:peptidoglycan glycosyltransferase